MAVQPAFVAGSISACGSSRGSFVPAFTTCARPSRAVAPVNRRARIQATAIPVEVTKDTFEEEVLKADKPVLVDFYAPWCGPCKLVAPLMDWAAIEFEGVVKVAKVNTDGDDTFVKKYGIHGLPTFAVFKKGKAHGVQEGALGKMGLKGYLRKHVNDI